MLRQPAHVSPAEIADCFADFDHSDDPELKKMLSAAVSFCGDMASPTAPARWLTLLGDPGCGKTMLAKRIRRFFRRHLDGLRDERFDQVTTVKYRTGGMKEWGAQVQSMIEGDYSGLRNLSEDWLVIIDDVGTEYDRHRELSRAKLFQVLNARVGIWTVITANLSVGEIKDRLDPRISSRLLRDGSEVIDCKAVDFATRRRA